MKVHIKTYEKHNMFCVEATVDGDAYLQQYFSSESERNEYYYQLSTFVQKIANSPKRQHRCFHGDRKWVIGRVIKTCPQTADKLRERTEYCLDCGIETDKETFWD